MALNLEKYGVGIGVALFILAVVYCLTDIGQIFAKNAFTEEYKSATKFAFSYSFSFLNLMFKVLLILLFIYIFIVIYDIAIVGIFKPLISENMDSNASITASSSAREIMEKARVSYFESIKAVARNTMSIVFGFINIPNALLILFFVIPLYILIVTFSYYKFISTKEKTKGPDQENILQTNYFYFVLLIFSVMTLLSLYFIYTTLTMS